jgi:hypothetical protein
LYKDFGEVFDAEKIVESREQETMSVVLSMQRTDANGVVDAQRRRRFMVSFVEGRSMVDGRSVVRGSGGGCLLVLRHCVGY